MCEGTKVEPALVQSLLVPWYPGTCTRKTIVRLLFHTFSAPAALELRRMVNSKCVKVCHGKNRSTVETVELENRAQFFVPQVVSTRTRTAVMTVAPFSTGTNAPLLAPYMIPPALAHPYLQ